MLPNQDTTTKTEIFFAPAEQYGYSHIVSPRPRSSGAGTWEPHIAHRWSARMRIVHFL